MVSTNAAMKRIAESGSSSSTAEAMLRTNILVFDFAYTLPLRLRLYALTHLLVCDYFD